MFPFTIFAGLGKAIGSWIGVLFAAILVTVLTGIGLVFLAENTSMFANVFAPWIAGFSAAIFIEVIVFVLTLFSAKD
jgi:hypothetical protein